MTIMALTIILTAYQYHVYCFFTFKNRIAQFNLRRSSGILYYTKLDFLKIRMRRIKSPQFLIPSQIRDLINHI